MYIPMRSEVLLTRTWSKSAGDKPSNLIALSWTTCNDHKLGSENAAFHEDKAAVFPLRRFAGANTEKGLVPNLEILYMNKHEFETMIRNVTEFESTLLYGCLTD